MKNATAGGSAPAKSAQSAESVTASVLEGTGLEETLAGAERVLDRDR